MGKGQGVISDQAFMTICINDFQDNIALEGRGTIRKHTKMRELTCQEKNGLACIVYLERG